jgi:hypothetical protein
MMPQRRHSGAWRAIVAVAGATVLAANGLAMAATRTTHPRIDGTRRTHTAARSDVHVAVNPPRTPFDCDTPRGADWFGSTEHCLQELCAGGNYTNEYVTGFDNRLRRNPCYGRDPYELQR